jgi:4-amino-4-deoxy-L-arabinose transferase-like glycosyltransferase
MSATSIRVWQTQNAGAGVPAPHDRASRTGAPRLDAHYALLAGVMLVYLHNTLPYLTTLPRVNVDEPWLMERAYQVMRTGVPNQPMLGLQHAYLLQVGYGYLLAGWMTLFGVGVLQARLFGVVLGAAIVILVAWIGRRTIDSITGVSAALFLALDSNFLGGVRNARTDIPSVFFVVVAFAAYLQGRRRSHAGWFVCAGASLGLAVLCHGNAFWAGVILLAWYVLDYGRRALVLRYGYAVLLGVLLTFGPYLAVMTVRWADVQVQIGNFAADRVPGWQPAFVLGQTLREIQRYRGWYFGLVTSAVPNPLLLAFQLLIAVGIVALAVRSLISRAGHTRVPADPRGAERLLILAIGGAFMFAAFINNKVPVYMPHLLVGFALAAGVAVSEALSFVPARRRALVTLSFVVAYGGAGAAYYEKWYATARKSELVSYEATTGTLRALVPPGPKYVYASPQFWTPFHAEPLTTFYSYAAAHPVDSGSAAILAGAADDRPIFLVVDEFQWLPELTGVSSSTAEWQHAWIAFIEERCALDGVALGTAHGTLALYQCALGATPAKTRTPRIVGGSTEYRIGDQVMSSRTADLAQWTPYEDPRRAGQARQDIHSTSTGLAIKGTGWPGIVRVFTAVPGESYLVRTTTEQARDGDLLYLGTWQQPQVRSLSGASASGIPAPLAGPRWYPHDRAFRATARAVRVLVYSEAAETDFVISSLDIYRLVPVNGARE